MSLSPCLSGTQRVQKLDFIQILRTVGWLSEMKRPKSAMCVTFLCLLLFALDTFDHFKLSGYFEILCIQNNYRYCFYFSRRALTDFL